MGESNKISGSEMHVLTQNERISGAKTPSIYKSLANSLKKRKRCSPKCFYFENCPLMSMSMASTDKKCMMKAFPERIRTRFTKVFLEGEEGMLNEIKGAIYQYGLQADASTSLKDKKEYIELMLKLHKAIYGDKTQVVSDKEPLQINIQQLSGVLPQNVEPKVIEAVESKRSVALKEAIMKDCEEEIKVETDPESLFGSPKLEGFVRASELLKEKKE